MTDLTIQERLRVHAAAGNHTTIDPIFMRAIADALDATDNTLALAKDYEAKGDAAFTDALRLYRKQRVQSYEMVAVLIIWLVAILVIV